MLETLAKCKFLNLTFLIYFNLVFRTPPTSLSVEVQYEKILNMFRLEGYLARNIPQVQAAVKNVLNVS